VAESLEKELGVPAPTIRRVSRHVMWVEYFFLDGVPSEERMSEIASKTGQVLGRRDNRFVPATHLYVRFMGFPWHPQWSCCAWCGEPVVVAVVVAEVVVYHEFCWWRRARLLRGSVSFGPA
jgi:hypothetical protein